MKKYDIGIFGLWYGHNYGSMITYYALNKVVRSMGYSTVMIENPLSDPNYHPKRRSHVKHFAKSHYDITSLYHLEDMYKLNDVCDKFLLGSDQMWNYDLSHPYRQAYYFGFADNKHPKISYATSFGKESWFGPAEEKPATKANLSRFSRISVRDDFSKNILKNDFEVESTVVEDPVFLCPVSEYEALAREAKDFKTDSRYIFAYILDPNPEIGAVLKRVATENNIKIYVVFDEAKEKGPEINALSIGDCDLIEYLLEPTVQEWLCLFKGASFVLTDSFHGTCFSIIFNKPFVVQKNGERGGRRFTFLLDKFGLSNHLVLCAEDIYNKFCELGLDCKIDYDRAFEKFKPNVDFSKEWLRDALAISLNLRDYPNQEAEKLNPYYGTKSYDGKADEPYFVLKKNLCTGCSSCANACPLNLIEMKMDNEGFLYPTLTNESKCTNCKLCERSCPVLNPTKKIKKNKEPITTYAAYSLDEELRYMSTSGGAFSEFAKQILAEGGVCYGAAYDKDFTIRHTRIDKVEDLPKIRQSKYYQSRIGDSYRQVKKDLEAGLKVMFCGAPCQANGLSAYLKKDYDNLFIVDFICHSVSSEKAFKAYLRELESVYKSKASNIWFKNKANGWHKFGTRIDFENKEEYYLRPWPEDYYMRGFLTYRCFQRPSCHNCSFKEYKRSADVTLADFWGLKWNNPNVTDDQENGVSIVMIHTQKAENLFKNFVSKNMYYEEHKIDEIPPKNGGLFSCQRVGLYRDFFFENVDKVPYSAIISSMAKREANIKAEKEKAQKNNIKKIGNVIFNIHPTAKLIVNGELICNFKLPAGSNKECVIILHENSVLEVNGKFAIGYDSIVQVFPGGKLTLNSGSVNAGAVFAVKNHSVIGRDFLGGRHFVFEDSDFHNIIDLNTNEIINRSSKGIVIKDHVWAGEGVTILKDVTVGEHSVLGAKALVTRDVPDHCVVAGAPAKVIKTNIDWKA